ncbi:hypothetical protein Tco_0391358, partial [Tanacetum coccineum]
LREPKAVLVAKDLLFPFALPEVSELHVEIRLSPTKPTTPCSSLSALAGESLRMNVGLDRGIKTSSTRRERIGESVTEMKA